MFHSSPLKAALLVVGCVILNGCQSVEYSIKSNIPAATGTKYDEAIAKNPNDPTLYFDRGTYYSDNGNYEMCIQDYTKVIGLKADDADAYFNRGWCKAQLSQCEESIKDYTKAIELNPKDADAYNGRALCYGDVLLDRDKAIEDLTKGIEVDPKNANLYYNRALFYQELDEKEKALSDVKKFLELAPDDQDGVDLLQELEE